VAEQVQGDPNEGFLVDPVPTDYVMSHDDMEVFLEGRLDLVEHEIRRLLRQVEAVSGPREEPFHWRRPREARTWLRAWTSLNYLVHARDAIRDALDPATRRFD
jgi:hypothetical protein